MIFCKKRLRAKLHNETVSINKTVIKEKDVVKYLGVRFDNLLSFNQNVKKILGKMAIAIKTIQAIGKNLPLKLRLTLLHSLVLPHVNYSAVLLTSPIIF